MTNVVARRIFDFLNTYPPFSLIDAETLDRVSQRVVVQYRRAGEEVFHQGDQPGNYIYVVREGAVHLVQQLPEGEVLVDQCGEGDVFGIRPLLTNENYALTARVVEETLLYAVNTEGFERLLSENPRLSYYLATSMATGRQRQGRVAARPQLFLKQPEGLHEVTLSFELQSIDRSREAVVCPPTMTVQAAAQVMAKARVGSIIVINQDRHPIGIVTDFDLRTKIATGQFPISVPVSELMSSPVVTARPDLTVADVQILMLKTNVHHLCITEDGTVHSPVLGVLSEHDLIVMQGNSPAVIVREIRRAPTARRLRELRDNSEDMLRNYMYQEVSITYITTIMTEINDEVIRRVLELAELEMQIKGLGRPPVPYAWLALGSEGRGEQLLRTDQDNAIVFEDVGEAQYNDAKGYFMQLAQRATDMLNDIGFAYCPGDMMASNPRWCLSLSKWKEQFSNWIGSPDNEALLHTSIFFDYRPVYGPEALAQALTEHIFALVDEHPVFLSFLAREALQNPPPLTFFRNFVVESGGEHKDEFDIKARAMKPMIETARVLIIEARAGKINNTIRRFETLAEREPQNRELYLEAAQAFEILQRLRTLQGLRNNNSGRYFNPSDLSKLERLHLRNAFYPIKELQTLLNIRFQLAYLR